MKMNRIKRKACIEIGDYRYNKETYDSEWDIYYFPTDITELDLAVEIALLAQHYDVLDLPISWPLHIRREKICAYIDNFQCNMLCDKYEKGCVFNATK